MILVCEFGDVRCMYVGRMSVTGWGRWVADFLLLLYKAGLGRERERKERK